MCGIAGIFHYGAQDRPADRLLLERMTRRIAHRGPDGEGIHLDGPVGLGHRRLAIVDLSPTGAQPMASDDGSLWITYNGEFYDHARFRAALAARRPFRGSSDTETLLRLFEERGAGCFGDIAAIFGLAIWDARRRVLTLARDAIGVKQVYYHDDGTRIVFASEIKALLACADVPRALDEEGLNQFLHFHTPLFERTMFRGIQQLRPGEVLEISARGISRRTCFRLDRFEHDSTPAEEVVATLRDKLAEVVKDQLMADVPVGAFFSGGIDSSAVTAFALQAGVRPPCFGVHFSGQGVIDERPFQEAAARALGVDLHLLTLTGDTFPEDLLRCLYHQDQPVIGPAMIPMFHINALAARHVKVCLGGQAGDEVFGGYARYALADPLRVMRLWAEGKLGWGEGRSGHGGHGEHAGHEPSAEHEPSPRVGGNLFRQLIEARTLQRLARVAVHAGDWRSLYFEAFAKVPERVWRGIVGAREIVSREACRALFFEEVDRSPARDPLDKVLHWDVRTYLPGLFHQDDRMSMAHGLESRVPLADPRLVRHAARIHPSLRIRGGATKWVLRRAVADLLPQEILGRRKVGFDTPVERWMRDRHHGFVRELLLGSRARNRGLWDMRGLTALLDQPGQPFWVDLTWKAVALEAWAQIFLDATPAEEDVPRSLSSDPDLLFARLSEPPPPPPTQTPHAASAPAPAPSSVGASPPLPAPSRPLLERARDAVQEARELGPTGFAFRVQWELGLRSGAVALEERDPPPALGDVPSFAALVRPIPFDHGPAVADALRDRMPPERLAHLRRLAHEATRGRVLCFSRWVGDYSTADGRIDWQRNPLNGRRWDDRKHWSRALADEGKVGDVKLTWEIGRFPQAYHFGRAAAFFPADRPHLAAALASQIRAFIADNPYGRGIHWASGQEIAFRGMAWLFGLASLGPDPALVALAPELGRALHEALVHLERHLDYARHAVYNNHLISEAFGILLLATVLPGTPAADRLRALGIHLLDEQSDAQVYEDGGYIQQSHTYHRVAMHTYLWASALLRRQGKELPAAWTGAMERSLDFLYAQQAPAGWLPNFGSNDGALPAPLSTCDYPDFRPVLQALSVITRGERLYEPGPWDEPAAWFAGPRALLDAPLRPRARTSVSFAVTGYHALRLDDPGSFCVLRCGTLRHRFSQIDMLSLDVAWRGHNVLVDPGSYLYNGPARWHEHFVGTAAHNTLTVDGRDQMMLYRRFKNLYPAPARRLSFVHHDRYALVAGEHHGYARHPGGCVHRRSVLQVDGDLWVVVDLVTGEGQHTARLHWLGGDFPHHHDPAAGTLTLTTPSGPFCVTVTSMTGAPLAGDVARGQEDPPRGWLSRHYAEKVPVPSLAVVQHGTAPLTFLSVLSAGRPEIRIDGDRVTVSSWPSGPSGEPLTASFQVLEGRIHDVTLGEPVAPRQG
ncbi:asparagine synthase (glutamine-hydrolyzing) [Chondromyces apiculatus]|uniref:asparagine synthase (glutamine-hydrolyzing) n=1 Tax=Chondromyces apiculatus DSM 436 TaxID=1192034 RepID=A0A017T4D5_9BACT|nr:asparagine synthase (glutamine-hydrolyzing) [Chondromyces apiculatus]EYF03872.1 Asparagine synthetase / glutamine-hydrolyzing protein [Chondromyces apiculatus DSM 436]